MRTELLVERREPAQLAPRAGEILELKIGVPQMIRSELAVAAPAPRRIDEHRPRGIRGLGEFAEAQEHLRLVAARAHKPLAVGRQLVRVIRVLRARLQQLGRRAKGRGGGGETLRRGGVQRRRFRRFRGDLRERLRADSPMHRADLVKRERLVGKLGGRRRPERLERALRVAGFEQRETQPVARRRRLLVIGRDLQEFAKPLRRRGELLLIVSAPARHSKRAPPRRRARAAGPTQRRPSRQPARR